MGRGDNQKRRFAVNVLRDRSINIARVDEGEEVPENFFVIEATPRQLKQAGLRGSGSGGFNPNLGQVRQVRVGGGRGVKVAERLQKNFGVGGDQPSAAQLNRELTERALEEDPAEERAMLERAAQRRKNLGIEKGIVTDTRPSGEEFQRIRTEEELRRANLENERRRRGGTLPRERRPAEVKDGKLVVGFEGNQRVFEDDKLAQRRAAKRFQNRQSVGDKLRRRNINPARLSNTVNRGQRNRNVPRRFEVTTQVKAGRGKQDGRERDKQRQKSNLVFGGIITGRQRSKRSQQFSNFVGSPSGRVSPVPGTERQLQKQRQEQRQIEERVLAQQRREREFFERQDVKEAELRVENLASLLTGGGGVSAEARGPIGGTAQNVAEFFFGLGTPSAGASIASGLEKFDITQQAKDVDILREDVKKEEKRAFKEFEKREGSFLPGGTPINRKGAATVISAGLLATGSVAGRTSKSKNVKPKKKLPVEIRDVTIEEAFRTRRKGKTSEIGRAKVRGEQAGKPFEADVGIVRNTRQLRQDIFFPELGKFKDASVGKSRAGAEVRQVNRKGEAQGEPIQIRSESRSISEGFGGSASGSRFVDFTKSQVKGEKGTVKDLPETVSPGRAREVGRFINELGKDVVLTESVNPTFVLKKNRANRVSRRVDPTKPDTGQQIQKISEEVAVSKGEGVSPKDVELFRISGGKSREVTIGEIPLGDKGKAQLSRLESGVIGLGGRENIAKIAREAQARRKAAVKISQQKGSRVNPPKKGQSDVVTDSFLKDFKDIDSQFFDNFAQLKQAKTVSKGKTRGGRPAQRPIADQAANLVKLGLETTTKKPTRSGRPLSSPFVADLSRDTADVGKVLSPSKPRVTQETGLFQEAKPGQDQPQDIGQDLFQPEKRRQAQRPGQDQFNQPSQKQAGASAFGDFGFGGFDGFTPKRRQTPPPPALPPLLELPRGDDEGDGFGKAKAVEDFEPDLLSRAFQVFSEKKESELFKQTKKRRGVGPRPIPKEFEDDIKEFNALLKPKRSKKGRGKGKRKKTSDNPFSGVIDPFL